jgi:hypothetical protein
MLKTLEDGDEKRITNQANTHNTSPYATRVHDSPNFCEVLAHENVSIINDNK